MNSLWQDLRYGARMLRQSPGFTVVAVLSLALGIGANTAIFQLLDAVRLKSLPISAPQQLVEVRLVDMTAARGNFSSTYFSVTNPIWEELRDQQQVFTGVSAWGASAFNLALGGEVRPARGLYVSGDFFNVLGVTAVMGRVFTASDDQRGCGQPGAVISHSFWQREYGGDKSVIGRKLSLDKHPFEIVGVTPESFFGLEVGRSFDVAIPICAEALINGKSSQLDSGTDWWLMLIGRLKPDVSIRQATSGLQAISPSLFQSTLPANYPPVSVAGYLNFKLEAVPAGAGFSQLRDSYERPLWLLLGIAGMVLLIACANLANLLLARASVREREMAIRQAVGASRVRLMRQLLGESLMLAMVGATLGVLLAQNLSRFLVSFLSTAGNSVFLDLALDWRVLSFTVLVAALTCILFGLTPALRATRIAPGVAMRASGRGLTASRERFSLRRTLVVVQVALSLVLVASALLFSRSLIKLLSVEPGFQQEGILITRAIFGGLNLPLERRLPFRKQLLERIRSIPGVEAVSESNIVPLSGSASSNSVWADGHPDRKLRTSFSRVGQDYFTTLHTPLLAGRDFSEHDVRNSKEVAVVNETFAKTIFADSNPIGQRFWIEATPMDRERQIEIVGLVKDTKYGDLREEFGPIAFLASAQDPRPGPYGQFLIRSKLTQAETTAAVRKVLGQINPAININFQSFKAMIEDSVLGERLMATLSGFFGLLALLLAGIGLYGILSYGVANRTNEFGIRMALGAQTRHVLSLVLREAVVLVLVGVAIGLPFVFIVTRFASTLLFGLKPTDPVSLGLAGLVLFVVALLAAYLPSRRATKVDPLVALRYE
jgi:putative ABC transport system permease protein